MKDLLIVSPFSSTIEQDAGGGSERLLVTVARGLQTRGYSVEILMRAGHLPDLSYVSTESMAGEAESAEEYARLAGQQSGAYRRVLAFEFPEVLPHIQTQAACWYMNDRAWWLPDGKISHPVTFFFVCSAHRNSFMEEADSADGLPLSHRTKILPPCLPEDLSRPSPSSAQRESDQSPMLLAASMWHPEKGVMDYLQTVKALLNLGVEHRAVLAGSAMLWPLSDSDEGLLSKLERHKFDDSVRRTAEQIPSVEVLGEIPRSCLQQRMAEADIFCLLSKLNEGAPISILEAQYQGAAVVSTPVGGIPEIVLPGETGVLVPPNSPSEAAQQIEELLLAPERLQRMKMQARRWVKKYESSTVLSQLSDDLFD